LGNFGDAGVTGPDEVMLSLVPPLVLELGLKVDLDALWVLDCQMYLRLGT
jgi:hypothetical protein